MSAVLKESPQPTWRAQSTLSSKGQITLPVELRERLGLVAGSKIAFVQDEQGVHLEVEKPTRAYFGYLKHLGNIDTTIPKEPDRDFDAIRRGESKYAKNGRPQ